MPFFCSICGEESTRICALCTKDACNNHLCEKCRRCSDCCECEVTLFEETRSPSWGSARAAVRAAAESKAPEPATGLQPPVSMPAPEHAAHPSGSADAVGGGMEVAPETQPAGIPEVAVPAAGDSGSPGTFESVPVASAPEDPEAEAGQGEEPESEPGPVRA